MTRTRLKITGLMLSKYPLEAVTKAPNYQLLTDRRNSKRTHPIYLLKACCPRSGFWQRLPRAEGSTKHVTHTDTSSISSNSSGKRSECHCRWSISIQWAETGQSARGPLWRSGTHLAWRWFVPNVTSLQTLVTFWVVYNRDCAHLEETQKSKAGKPKINQWEKGKKSPFLPRGHYGNGCTSL